MLSGAVAPLIEAVWKNDAAKVALLIKQGHDVNVKHEDTVLVEAAGNKQVDIEIVKMLLNAKGININLYSTRPMGAYSWYRTPLIAAMYAGNIETVDSVGNNAFLIASAGLFYDAVCRASNLFFGYNREYQTKGAPFPFLAFHFDFSSMFFSKFPA